MAPTNDFVAFCPTDTGTNLLSQSAYLADPQLAIGNQPGTARSKLVNKALRQSTVVSSQIAQLIANMTGGDMLDDGTTAAMLARMVSALVPKAPTFQALTATGTYNKSYRFQIVSGSATIGAVYTNNGHNFTVSATVASATEVVMTGDGAPSLTGVLTKSSGTGDATLSFYAVAKPKYLLLKAVGGGGGGGGTSGSGGTGGDTTFGSLLTAHGGSGGVGASGDGSGGSGGSASISAPAYGVTFNGSGGGAGLQPTGIPEAISGSGAPSPFGGAGIGVGGTGAGQNAAANSGSGGSGCANAGTGAGGNGGGGSGGFAQAYVADPDATYAFVIGAAGTGGTGGPGGAGGTGLILVEEHYQ